MSNIKYMALAATLCLSMASCSDNIMDEINKDEAHPVASVVNAKFQISDGALATTYSVVNGAYAWYVSSYTEQLIGTGNNQMMRVEMRDPVETAGSTTFNNEWNSTYLNLNNLLQIIEKCAPGMPNEGNYDILAMAQVLTAINWGVLTDLHGDIPCSEAFKGSAPKIDKQSDVYDQIFALLDGSIDNATQAISGNLKNAGDQDIVFKNDMKQWRALAHALKARYKMRLYGRDKSVLATVKSEAEAAIADGFKGALVQGFNGVSADNSWSAYWWSRYYIGSSKTVDDLMAEREDPRRSIYNWQFNEKESIVGIPGNSEHAHAIETVNYPGWLENGAAYLTLMGKAELYFILAEAKARSNEDASADLATAVTASLADYAATSGEEIATDAATAYLAKVDELYKANGLAEVMVQKYIGLVRDGQIETYNDIRRCRYSDGKYYVTFTNSNNQTSSGENRWPLCLPYGNSDVVSNPNIKAVFGEGNDAGTYIFKKNVWFAGGE